MTDRAVREGEVHHQMTAASYQAPAIGIEQARQPFEFPLHFVGHLRCSLLTVKLIQMTVTVTLVNVNRIMTVTVIFVAISAMLGYPRVMITAAQIRAARALIGWKQTDLATASGLSEMSVKNIERGVTDPRVSTMIAIQSALEQAGVTFLDSGAVATGQGVSLKL